MHEETSDPSIDMQEEIERARLIAFLFARHHEFRSVEDISLFGILTEVTVPLEETKRQMDLSVFIRVAGKFTESIYIHMHSPTQGMVEAIELQLPNNISVEEDVPKYVETVWTIPFIFKEIGVYWFDVQYQHGSLGKIPLLVRGEEKHNDNTSSPT